MTTVKQALMASAWQSFVVWAASEPAMLQAYTEATGHTLPSAPKSGLERMIDEATGYQDKALFDFAAWVTEAHWGMKDAPAAFQRAVRGNTHDGHE